MEKVSISDLFFQYHCSDLLVVPTARPHVHAMSEPPRYDHAQNNNPPNEDGDHHFNNPSHPLFKYEKIEKIGEGTYGVVKKSFHGFLLFCTS